ncbi:hypothetical protein OIDMADRAFT_18635 [Oidiodendron maius Zn]|uniref:Uncharacterized protein n=1 Tax=Oidiodendron maius (strain Zn) TaxID=913774 RepID=A0A0C3DI98_OIDMZ|nr:hypothetical protein OIDMADRAFT_18635 [Oidiodendron maius Zn]
MRPARVLRGRFRGKGTPEAGIAVKFHSCGGRGWIERQSKQVGRKSRDLQQPQLVQTACSTAAAVIAGTRLAG